MKITDFITETKVLVETRTPNQILLELNVINIPQIDTFLNDIAQNLPTKETQKWFTTRAKKYLINSENDNAIVTHFSGKAEPWMKQKQKEGVSLYRFNPSADLANKFTHIVDWVRAMQDTVTGVKASDQQSTARAKKALKGLANTSITQAIELSNQWVTDMNSGKDASYKRAEDETGLVPVMVHGEYKWYKLTDQDCLDREGKVMGHCVASYGASVTSGKTVIYSLRDTNNFAHATVEVHSGQLEQVKGKRNAPPVEKYQRATVALLNTLNVPPTSNGMRDINGMGFIYNASNHKYGTVQDVGNKLRDEGGMTVWSIGGNTPETINLRIFANDKEVCRIAPNRYSSGLKYEVVNISNMKNIAVKGAKHNDPHYKLAKFITLKMPETSTTGIDLDDLTPFMDITKDKMLAMQEDIGQSVFVDGDDELRRVEPNTFTIRNSGRDGRDMFIHTHKGGYVGQVQYNAEEKNIADRQTIGATNDYRGINGNTLKIVAKYINTLKSKDRPIIQDDGVYQNPKTFEASTTITNASETIAVSKSGKFGWYKIINSTTEQNNASHRRRFSMGDLDTSTDKATEVLYRYALMNQNQIMVTIGVNADESKHKFDIYYRDSIDNLSQADAVEVADVFNKSGLNKFYPFTDGSVVSAFETVGLYFLRESRKFTTDHSVAGEQFQHDDKEFKAIKTHNNLKIYFKGAEVVIFDLDNSEPVSISGFRLKNKLAMLNNAGKIADVLNHYELHRGDPGNYAYAQRDTNKKIAQAGLTYSDANGWKGMKSGPKPIENNQGETTTTINGSEYEIHSFKRDFLIQNAGTHELVATLKGFKNVNDPVLYISEVKMENQKDASFDIVADALNELHQRDGVRVTMASGSFKHAERFDFNDKMHERGYTGTKGGWESIVNKYPSEVISKGPGGTWVSEAFTSSSDPSIETQQNKNKNNRYRDDQTSADKAMRKYHEYNTGLGKESYTLYSRKTPILRAFVRRGGLQAVYSIVANEDGETDAQLLHSKESLIKHGNVIGRLLHKLGTGGGAYLTDHQLYLAKGKIQDITKNPKLAGFISGEIVYEDGHKWKRGGSYREDEWLLTMPNDQGRDITLIKASISNDGLQSIEFTDEKIRKRTKLYRPFLNDIMDIVDELHGSD